MLDLAEGWQKELAELEARAEAAETGLTAEVELMVIFRGPSEVSGVRVEGLDASTLTVEVTLPHGLVRDRGEILLILLQEALDAADTFLEDRADDLWSAWQVMSRVCSAGTQYERWMDAYMVAHHQPEAVATQPCPSCGEPRLQLEFEVRDPCATYGTAYFWCNACLKGPMPTKAPLPPQAKPAPWGTLNPPNFTIVPDE